jgi:CheY-like chemotaxis protein
MAKHALIIDDDAMSLGVLSQLLELEHFTYTAVQDSSQIEKVIANLARVDVVFLDLEMPQLNGYNVFDYLKHDVGITAPIVAHTVHVSESNVVRSMGFDAFICKPIDSDNFHDQLQQILDGNRIWIVSNR